MKQNDALQVIFERNSFYRRLHFLALAAVALSLIVIGVLISLLLYVYRNPLHPLYFATDKVSRLINVIPVTVPNMKTEEVIAWTINAIQNSLSMDYVNYRTQIQNSQRYFTNYGWTKYMQSLQANNNIVALNQRRMIVIAQVVEQPKILAQGVLAGAYAWRFQMPVLITYWLPPYDDNSKFANPLDITIIVQRQPILQSVDGLGILQIIGNIVTTSPTATKVTPNGG